MVERIYKKKKLFDYIGMDYEHLDEYIKKHEKMNIINLGDNIITNEDIMKYNKMNRAGEEFVCIGIWNLEIWGRLRKRVKMSYYNGKDVMGVK